MAIIMPPANDRQVPNHPDLPEQGEEEDLVEYIGRVADWFDSTPPAAPMGFRMVECERDHRHHPLYEVAEDVFYPRPCPDCVSDGLSKRNRELVCERDHRKWKSWRTLGWLSGKGYVLGITSSGGTSYGRCEFCGIGRQYSVRFRGRRVYFLGLMREEWFCLRRGHRRVMHYPSGLCAICCPCPECGSTDADHYTCEASA